MIWAVVLPLLAISRCSTVYGAKLPEQIPKEQILAGSVRSRDAEYAISQTSSGARKFVEKDGSKRLVGDSGAPPAIRGASKGGSAP